MAEPSVFIPSVHPFRPLLTLVRDRDGRVLERSVTMELTEEGLEAFDRVLEPFALSWAILGRQLNDTFPALEAWPWAVIAFQKEFRLMGHACSLRRKPVDYSLSSYTSSGTPNPLKQGIPSLSLILLRHRDVLEDLVDRSMLFRCAWELLKEADDRGRWLALPENPPEDWVRRAEQADDDLFRQVLAGG